MAVVRSSCVVTEQIVTAGESDGSQPQSSHKMAVTAV